MTCPRSHNTSVVPPGPGPISSVEPSREPKPPGVQSTSNWPLGFGEEPGTWEGVGIPARPNGPLSDDLGQDFPPTPGSQPSRGRMTSKGPSAPSPELCSALRSAHLRNNSGCADPCWPKEESLGGGWGGLPFSPLPPHFAGTPPTQPH